MKRQVLDILFLQVNFVKRFQRGTVYAASFRSMPTTVEANFSFVIWTLFPNCLDYLQLFVAFTLDLAVQLP